MNTSSAIIRYIEQITGQVLALAPLSGKAAAKIPVFLMELYDLSRIKLFDRELILAIAKDHEEKFTPSEYAGHSEQFQDVLGEDVVLVLSHVAAYDRNRLVKQNVAFIVPERQLFLPRILVDLKDYFPHRKRKLAETLSYPAQVVVLYHLLKKSIEPYSLRKLADCLVYSAMTLSNVGDELSAMGLCDVIIAGRKRHLYFKAKGQKLWELALPHLRSPVRTRRWVRGNPINACAVKSGMTALSDYTQIGADPFPTYAMRDNECHKKLANGDLAVCHADEAEAQIEAWFYAPELLAENSRADRLSLFLILRNSPDERLAKALRELLEGVQW